MLSRIIEEVTAEDRHLWSLGMDRRLLINNNNNNNNNDNNNYLTPWLMEPEVQCRIHKGRINPIPRIDTYLFMVHSNIGLGLLEGLFPVGLPLKILKPRLPFSILAT